MKDFNVLYKIFFARFSVIFDANNRDKFKKKRVTDRANREKNINVYRNRFKKSKTNQTNREENVNILKTFINNFLNDAVTFLKLSNEVNLMLKFKT